MDLINKTEHSQKILDQHADSKNSISYTPPSLRDWVKVEALIEQYSQFTLPQLRWLLLHRKSNGLSQYVRKIGKPLYINVPGFLQWISDDCER